MKIDIGVGFLLFIVFLILKLTGAIAWSWWWITCPLWIGIALKLVLMAVMGIVALIAAFFGSL